MMITASFSLLAEKFFPFKVAELSRILSLDPLLNDWKLWVIQLGKLVYLRHASIPFSAAKQVYYALRQYSLFLKLDNLV